MQPLMSLIRDLAATGGAAAAALPQPEPRPGPPLPPGVMSFMAPAAPRRHVPGEMAHPGEVANPTGDAALASVNLSRAAAGAGRRRLRA